MYVGMAGIVSFGLVQVRYVVSDNWEYGLMKYPHLYNMYVVSLQLQF